MLEYYDAVLNVYVNVANEIKSTREDLLLDYEHYANQLPRPQQSLIGQSMDQIEVSYLDKPFKIKDMPLDKVYVIDNYLETSLHHWIENYLDTANMWSKSNKVRGQSKTGLPHHELWGAAFFVGQREDGSLIRDCTNFQSLPGKYLNRRICTDFGFK